MKCQQEQSTSIKPIRFFSNVHRWDLQVKDGGVGAMSPPPQSIIFSAYKTTLSRRRVSAPTVFQELNHLF
jgi:hypothetical protein